MENYTPNANLVLFDALRSVPTEATRPITSGPLEGMTDISPVWRYQRLTEVFGPYGIGWWLSKPETRIEKAENGEVKVFVDVALYFKYNGQESAPLYGTGGASFVSLSNAGEYKVSDECFKSALTDAISVAAKPLGLAADVYMSGYGSNPVGRGDTKYSANCQPTTPPQPAYIQPNEPAYPFAPSPVPASPVPGYASMPSMAAPVNPYPQQSQNQIYPMAPAVPAGSNSPLTRDEALSFIVNIGKYKDKPTALSDVVATDRGCVEFYASERFDPRGRAYASALKEASKMVLNIA